MIAASNRAGALDPALLRPGRFDRRLHFDLPNAAARRELVDYLLARKAHHGELDDDLQAHGAGAPDLRLHAGDDRAPARRGAIWALRDGRDGMRWADINQAKLSGEIGLKQPVACTPLEEMVATHEAGHAVAAHLSGVGRKLEVLSIVKRKKALGLLAHNGRERTERLPRDAKAAVREQLDRNRVLVEALRDALLEREELVGDEILEAAPSLLAGRPAAR